MNLMAALMDATRPVRWAEIRQNVPGYGDSDEGARKTFELDKRALRELGVPIETIEGSTAEETGYRVITSRYEMPEIELDPDELAALHLALQTLQVGVTDGDITRALWRLGGTLDPDDTVAAAAAVVDEVHEIPAAPALLPLFRAIAERSAVRFDYETAAGGVGARVVEPWSLSFERGRWYVHVHDRERAAARNYRLDRIRGDVRLDGPGTATVPAESSSRASAAPWEFGDGEPIMAELRLDPVVAPIGAVSLGSARSRVEADGSSVWTVPVANWPAFRSFVLSFRDRAEILSPPELRESMVDWLEAIVDAPTEGTPRG